MRIIKKKKLSHDRKSNTNLLSANVLCSSIHVYYVVYREAISIRP